MNENYTDSFYETLDAGIRGAVRRLHELNFQTSDSGDGTKAGTMECALDVPMIAVLIDEPNEIVPSAERIADEVRSRGLLVAPGPADLSDLGGSEVYIQANYDPSEQIALICLFGAGLLNWEEGAK